MYKFGDISTQRLSTAHGKLQVIAHDVIKFMDHTIVTGHRDKATQDKLYPKFSKVQWPNSKHNSNPSLAIDVAPFVKPYGAIFGNVDDIQKIMNYNKVSKAEAQSFIIKAYARLIGAYEAVAYQHGVILRVGLDWDNDFDMTDQRFHDLGHLEIR